MTVLPDDDDVADPAGLHDLPSGLRTPPTPPPDHSQSALTLMNLSLSKEASQLLCDAMRCRLEDEDASSEIWKDSGGREFKLAPDRF